MIKKTVPRNCINWVRDHHHQLRTFGEPTKSLEGGSLLFFSWTRGGASAFMGMGSTDTETKSLMIEFDDSNIVKDFRLTRGSPIGSN